MWYPTNLGGVILCASLLTFALCENFVSLFSRNSCESRVKSAEKAESDAEKIKSNAKAKEIEKLKKHAFQTRQAAEKANEQYKTSVVSLEGARQHWVTAFVCFKRSHWCE